MRSPQDPRRCMLAGTRFSTVCLLLVGLAAGCGQDKPRKPDFSAPNIPGSELVVLDVAGEPITAGEVYHKIRLQYPQMSQSGPSLGRQVGEVVKQIVREKLLVKLGEERGYENIEYQRMLYFSRTYILTTETVNGEVWQKVRPSDEDVARFYAENQDRFHLRGKVWYHEILVGSEAQARAVRERLLTGGDFAKLAQEFSIDRTAASRGGEMPPYEQGQTGARLDALPQIVQALFALEPQTVSEPIRSADGWHVVRVDGRREDQVRPLEEVREEIRNGLSAKREGTVYNALIDSLTQAYGATVHEDALERFYFLQMDDSELFETARDDRDPARSVRMYEDLLARFPKSERCGEARFMIGFLKAEKLSDPAGATEAFERFLADFPQHEMSASAKAMLDELKQRRPE